MNRQEALPAAPRLLSLDALRGLDMLVILGLDGLFCTWARVFPDNGVLQELAYQMGHEPWMGLRAYDLVFPVFVFIAGVAMAFSLVKYGTERGRGIWHLWRRAGILVVLGCLVNGNLSWTEHMRYASVLGLIGISCAVAGSLVLWRPRPGFICGAIGVILAVVACLQFLCGDFSPGGSVNARIDQHWLPGRLHNGVFDPEGPLCVLAAVPLALGGWLTGRMIQAGQQSQVRLVLTMLIGGVVLCGTAWLLHGVYPVIKNMWTGTFVLAAGGAGLASMGIFYGVIDAAGLRGWSMPLRVVGVNAICAYLMIELLNVRALNHRIFIGVADWCTTPPALFLSCSLLVIQWVVLWFMWRRGVRFSV